MEGGPPERFWGEISVDHSRGVSRDLSLEKIPQHIAIIMDGNRRWAREHKLPPWEGHRAGGRVLKEIVEACRDLGVKVLTAYAFSKENWKRSQEEIKLIFYLFDFYLKQELENMNRNGVRFQTIGRIHEMPQKLQEEFKKTEALTAHNQNIILNLAVNYSGRAEIVDAAKSIAQQIKEGKLDPSQIDEERFSCFLYTSNLPDPDLLIRTSGELRISNFLLWQMAYTEFWFTPLYWPDFTKEHLLEAILEYQRRNRRLGGS
jgi:undecaprenyl diphosphate synthase